MAKLTKDKLIKYFDPAERVLHSAPADADTYPVGSIVALNEGTGRVTHVTGSITGAVVGMVHEHQVVAKNGDLLEYQSGLHAISGSGFTSINQVAYFDDSDLAMASSGSSGIPGGYYRGPVQGAGPDMVMIDLGKAPKE